MRVGKVETNDSESERGAQTSIQFLCEGWEIPQHSEHSNEVQLA